MEILNLVWDYAIPFVIILTVLVFVHELGHYLVARRCGVRVEVFSIGFGPELFGFTDRAKTRWKFAVFPLGGYVKMFGDSNVVSMRDGTEREMSPEERAVSFHYQSLPKRAAIVFAGPLANFLFAVVVLTGLFAFVGQPHTSPVIGAVLPDSAAAEAGIQAGDRIVEINGRAIERFQQVQQIVHIGLAEPLEIVVERDGRRITLQVRPKLIEEKDLFGNSYWTGRLGVQSGGLTYVRYGPLTAFWRSVEETVVLTRATLKAAGQMIVGERSRKEVGGPLRIAQMAGEVSRAGIVKAIWFMALLSINLGLINLFPVPMLDGGHLLFYAVEAIRGRPMGERAQEYGFRIGLTLVFMVLVFATWNDLTSFNVIEFFKGLIS